MADRPNKTGLGDGGPAADYYGDGPDLYCPNCGGDGVIYSCFEEWACVDPESGCDECERACDWCKPRRASSIPPTSEEG